MELLFIALYGVLVGLVAYFSLPYRRATGPVLIPALGGAFAMALWVALTWAGLKWDAGVIWWITLIATAAAVAAAGLVIGRRRSHADAHFEAAVAKGAHTP